MIHFKICFEKYDWEVEIYIVLRQVRYGKIMKSLADLDCPEREMHLAYDNLQSGVNSGFTYTNDKTRQSLMVINYFDSMYEFINTYNHEKNHVEMHICENLGIDPYSEEAAYLSGELAQQLYLPAICSLLV